MGGGEGGPRPPREVFHGERRSYVPARWGGLGGHGLSGRGDCFFFLLAASLRVHILEEYFRTWGGGIVDTLAPRKRGLTAVLCIRRYVVCDVALLLLSTSGIGYTLTDRQFVLQNP